MKFPSLVEVALAKRQAEQLEMETLRRSTESAADARERADRQRREVREDRVRKLHTLGLNDREIADEMNISSTRVHQQRSRLGLPANLKLADRRPRGPGVTRWPTEFATCADRDEAVRVMFREGQTDAAIGEALGLARTTVLAIRQRLGLAARSRRSS